MHALPRFDKEKVTEPVGPYSAQSQPFPARELALSLTMTAYSVGDAVALGLISLNTIDPSGNLAPAASRVRRIKVHFSDVNGPRGGVDQRCRIQATMEGLGEVIIEDVEANPFRAIAIGAGRIGRSILRRLRRRKTHSRADARRVWGADNSDNAQL